MAIRIILDIDKGENIHTAALRATEIAWQTCQTVGFTFNDVTLGVHMGANVADVLSAYDKAHGTNLSGPIEVR